MDLSVPVVHTEDLFHTPVKDVMVDYSTDWVRKTEYAIRTAYFSSPFFIYYQDALFSIMDSRPSTLWELDLRLIEFFCEKTGIAPRLEETSSYRGADIEIHPKRPSSYSGKPYWQVFADRSGFVPNLSIMDLLFNEGPESLSFLL